MEVIAVGPDDAKAFHTYFERESLPFRGVPDPGGKVLALLGQEVNWFKLGRMPALLAVTSDGEVVHVHKGGSMRDLPDLDAAVAALGASGGGGS